MENLQDLRINVAIKETKFKGGGDDRVVYSNAALTFHIFKKWLWYFDYRMALEKIKCPRKHYEVKTYRYFIRPENEVKMERLGNKIRGAKSSITKKNNLLKKYEAHVKHQLFDAVHTDKYQLAIERINELEIKLWDLQLQFLNVEYEESADKILTNSLHLEI